MTSKMLDWKIQPDFMRVKTIQYDAIGRVLDCVYTSEEAEFNSHFCTFLLNKVKPCALKGL